VLEVPEVMRCVLLCLLEMLDVLDVMRCVLRCLMEVLEVMRVSELMRVSEVMGVSEAMRVSKVINVSEVMHCVLLYLLKAMRRVLLCMLEAVEGRRTERCGTRWR